MSRKYAVFRSRVVKSARASMGLQAHLQVLSTTVSQRRQQWNIIKIEVWIKMNKKTEKKEAVEQQHFELKAETDLTASCIHQKQTSATKLALEEQRITRQRQLWLPPGAQNTPVQPLTTQWAVAPPPLHSSTLLIKERAAQPRRRRHGEGFN